MKKFYINKNLIFVALLVVIQLFREEISEKIFNLLKYDYTKYECNFDFLKCISKLFLFIPYLLNKKLLFKNKKNENEIILSKAVSNSFFVKKINYFDKIYLKFQICFFIFSSSFLNFFTMNIYQTSNYFYYSEFFKFNYDEYYPIFLFILYQIISNTKFYNFHYISIFILLFVLIIKNIFNLYEYKEEFINNLKVNLSLIILRTLFSLDINIIKYLNVIYYMDMYLIIFISDGILYFIYICIYQLIFKNFFKYLDFSSSNLLYYFIFIVIYFLNDYIFIIVLFLFNPIYYGFAILMRISISNFYELFIKKNSNFYNISIIFISLFDLISVLIYSELIQLNCYNLSRNTMNNMIIRAESELEINNLPTIN